MQNKLLVYVCVRECVFDEKGERVNEREREREKVTKYRRPVLSLNWPPPFSQPFCCPLAIERTFWPAPLTLHRWLGADDLGRAQQVSAYLRGDPKHLCVIDG